MANAFQNPVVYTNECLRSLDNAMVFSKHVSREYDDKFAQKGGKIGDTLNIRRPARFTVSSGAALSTQDYTETSIPLVINAQKHIDTSFTSADLTLKVEQFSERIIKPAMIQLAAQVDQDGLLNAKNTVGNLTGTAGTSPNNVSFLFDVGARLDDFSTPRDGERWMVVDQRSNASLVAAMTGFFNDPRIISSQFKDAVFVNGDQTIGLKLGMSQNVQRHTVGPLGGAPLVNGAGQGIAVGWANTGTLITDGWTAAAAQRTAQGDVFTVAALFSVNPVTRQSTGQLMQFVCTAAQSSDGAGNLVLTISPAIITAGPFQNVAAAPVDNNALTFVGTAATAYARNMAWHKDAFCLGTVDLINLAEFGGWGARRSYNGMSLRVFRQAAIATDTVANRIDILYGWATPYPEQAAQQVSA